MNLRRYRTPRWQLAAAVAIMMAGGYLVALWMLGVMVMVGGGIFAFDALRRDDGTPDMSSHQQILERWRKSA